MSKKPLHPPLEGLFEQRLPAQTMDRIWQRIRRREAARARPRTSVWLASASAACVLLVLGAYFWSRPSPLRLVSHDPIPASLSSKQSRVVSFADGSQVELGPLALLDVLQNSERAFVVALRTGQARFNVVPGGPRAWRVECGPVSVDVVGTIFSVERSPVAIKVRVERGRVLVSGEGVPDRVARIGANESILVPIASLPPTPSAGAGQGASAGSGSVGERAFAPPVTSEVSPSPRPSSVAHRLDDQAPAAAIPHYSAREPPPTTSRIADPVGELLQRADAAGREGAPVRAVALLQRVLAEYPQDVRATLAQFTLGKLYLDSLSDPERAVVYFTRAIAGGIPGALAEDAHARLVQAFARAGNLQGATNAAARYRSRYPTGRHLQDVNRWAASASGQ